MLYICIAMFLDIAIFIIGLTMSIIDVNRYNFGLYLVLMSVVAFSLLIAVWVARPTFCRTPSWAIRLYHAIVKSSRPNYRMSNKETESLMGPQNADDIMRSIKGIPLLIQAIQYSLEAAYVAPLDSTTANRTMTDSAIESNATNTHECYPNVITVSFDQSDEDEYTGMENAIARFGANSNLKIAIGGNSNLQSTSSANSNVRNAKSQIGANSNIQTADHQIFSPEQRRRMIDLKRQSIFVVFPYSETVPLDQTKLQLRRSSSDYDMASRKSSFQRFYTAAIAGQSQRHSSAIIDSENESENERDRRRSLVKSIDQRRTSSLKVENVRTTETRRPSIEVRYVGLQGILLAKMSSRHGSP